MLRQFELVEKVKAYDPYVDEDALNRAYVFALKMHGQQKRASGDPYYAHPVEVAGILTDYKLDYASIATALLHDTVEDTSTSVEDIASLFGEDIASLVDGVTKLSQLEMQSENKQAENFRKLVLAMSKDIRVLLVKLADRLHNMRTLHFVTKPEKRKRIARETMDIYAPLAERIGMQEMKNELEGLSFKELYPDAYELITEKLQALRDTGDEMTSKIMEQLREDLVSNGVNAELTGREKSPYSIWRKMHSKNMAFEDICDIIAFRVIVDNIGECYQTLGVINTKYPMVPGRYKDYISTPKKNGYRSLHTGVIGPYNKRIEVQIRTEEMHRVADFGVAAHWGYKQGMPTDGTQFKWVRELLYIIEQTSTAEEFLENTKMDMYQDEVFCFTPTGDIITLPKGSTPIDFAYGIHSGVGNRCVGAKINGMIKPLRTVLSNGDQVEIITSKIENPSPEWERFVVTGKARASIRKFIREQKRTQFMELGKQLILRALKESIEKFEKDATKLFSKYSLPTMDDLYAQIGEGIISPTEIIEQLYPKETKKTGFNISRMFKSKPKKEKYDLPISGLIPGMVLHFAKCCHPLPGDKIVGIVSTGKGVTIHTVGCSTLKKYEKEPERFIDVGWNIDNKEGKDEIHTGRLDISLLNVSGGLVLLSNAIAKAGGNINNLAVVNKSKDFIDLTVDIEVKNSNHLYDIVASLRSTDGIGSVRRSKSG